MPVCSGREPLRRARLPAFPGGGSSGRCIGGRHLERVPPGEEVADLAETFEVNCAPHNYYSHLATLIAAQWCAAIPNAGSWRWTSTTSRREEKLTTALRRSAAASSSCPPGQGGAPTSTRTSCASTPGRVQMKCRAPAQGRVVGRRPGWGSRATSLRPESPSLLDQAGPSTERTAAGCRQAGDHGGGASAGLTIAVEGLEDVLAASAPGRVSWRSARSTVCTHSGSTSGCRPRSWCSATSSRPSPARGLADELGCRIASSTATSALRTRLLELEPFDLVFFLGVLYHAAYHLTLLSMLNRVTRARRDDAARVDGGDATRCRRPLRWPPDREGEGRSRPALRTARLDRLAESAAVHRLPPGLDGGGFLIEKTDELEGATGLAPRPAHRPDRRPNNVLPCKLQSFQSRSSTAPSRRAMQHGACWPTCAARMRSRWSSGPVPAISARASARSTSSSTSCSTS